MTQQSSESPTQIIYESSDLEVFAKATNWKTYWSDKLRPYVRGQVIEVGAGLGVSTKYLCIQESPKWLCLDPDPSHVAQLARMIAAGELPGCCEARGGVLADLSPDVLADTIMYIDVLEHIEADEKEISLAASHLRVGGHIVVLSPAFGFLYSPFDKAVGHYRRYEKSDVGRLTANTLVLVDAYFLDSIGFLASLTNRMLLKSSMPTSSQIALWDRVMIPLSKYADILFKSLFGRSIVMIWRKT
jgi:SAM-dependent methyltransferase